MKKLSFSERKKLYTILMFFILQIIYWCLAIAILCNSLPVSQSEIQHTSLTVEETKLIRYGSEYKFIIEANSVQYLFDGRSQPGEYSTTRLHEAISQGNQLDVSYAEKNLGLFRYNLVLAAQSGDIQFRTIPGYYAGKQGIGIKAGIILFVFDIILIAAFFLSNPVFSNKRELKRLIRKLTK